VLLFSPLHPAGVIVDFNITDGSEGQHVTSFVADSYHMAHLTEVDLQIRGLLHSRSPCSNSAIGISSLYEANASGVLGAKPHGILQHCNAEVDAHRWRKRAFV